MNCKEVDIKMIAFVDKQLSENESGIVWKHIESCDACKAYYDETMILMGAFKNEAEHKPSDSLRKNFLSLLDEEKQLQKGQVVQLKQTSSFNWKQAFQIAASFLLLFLGFFAGNYMSKQNASKEIAVLQEQTIELKENMMLAMMNNRSASKRIQAVNYSEELKQPDVKIMNAIVDRMHHDPNINVRLSAAEALSRYSEMELVKKAFIDALGTEKNPDLQIAIIQFLVTIEDKRALEPMRQLLGQPEVPDYVKEQANSGISKII